VVNNPSIRELAEAGWGRTRIMRAHPEATEWLIRQVINEVRGYSKRPVVEAVFADTKPAPIAKALQVLQPITINVPPPVDVTARNPNELFTIILLGDAHVPFHDPANLAAALGVIRAQRRIRLDMVILIGDIFDFYAVSKYDKNPLRRNLLQDELIVAAEVLGQITEAAGDATKVFVRGNHEQRLEDYIWRHAPALAGLPQLQIPALLGLESAGWQYEPFYYPVNDKFVVRHGDTVAGASGATAKKELDDALISGASGHVHRLGVHYRTAFVHRMKNEPPFVWVETGTLARPDLEYLEGKHPNWQPGLAIVRFDSDGYPFPEPVSIHNGRAVFSGLMVEAA
jgi:hypothetical protein